MAIQGFFFKLSTTFSTKQTLRAHIKPLEVIDLGKWRLREVKQYIACESFESIEYHSAKSDLTESQRPKSSKIVNRAPLEISVVNYDASSCPVTPASTNKSDSWLI